MPMPAAAGSTVVMQVSSKGDSSHWFPVGTLDLPNFSRNGQAMAHSMAWALSNGPQSTERMKPWVCDG